MTYRHPWMRVAALVDGLVDGTTTTTWPSLVATSTVPIAEAVHDDAFKLDRGGVRCGDPLTGRGQRHLVGQAQVKAERFGTLDHPSDIGIAAQQVVDELSPERFLLTDHLPPRALIALQPEQRRRWRSHATAPRLRRAPRRDCVVRTSLRTLSKDAMRPTGTNRPSCRHRRADALLPSVACLKSFDGAWLWRGFRRRSWST